MALHSQVCIESYNNSQRYRFEGRNIKMNYKIQLVHATTLVTFHLKFKLLVQLDIQDFTHNET